MKTRLKTLLGILVLGIIGYGLLQLGLARDAGLMVKTGVALMGLPILTGFSVWVITHASSGPSYISEGIKMESNRENRR